MNTVRLGVYFLTCVSFSAFIYNSLNHGEFVVLMYEVAVGWGAGSQRVLQSALGRSLCQDMASPPVLLPGLWSEDLCRQAQGLAGLIDYMVQVWL